MNHLRGVLFLAFALLIAQVLAEEGREKQEFGNFGSFSSDANMASDVRTVPLRTSNVESLAAGNTGNMVDTVSNADEALTRNNFDASSTSQFDDSIDDAGAREAQLSFLEADRRMREQQKRATAEVQLTFAFTLADTNDTVTTTICNALNNTVTRLTTTSPKIFQVPACVATSSLTFINLERMASSSFTVFPVSMETLFCSYCVFRYDPTGSTSPSTPISTTPASQAIDGFNTDGTINWTEFFTHFTNLVNLRFDGSQMTGQLPATLPARIKVFSVRGVQNPFNGISGDIPATFFSNIGASATADTYFTMDIAFTRLTGTIPATFFSPFSGKAFREMSFTLYNTPITGTYPAALFTPLSSANMESFLWDATGNTQVGGALPSIPSGIARTGGSFRLAFDGTPITGTIPEGWLAGLPNEVDLIIGLANTKLSGPLPNTLFAASRAPSRLRLDLSNSGLSGPLTNFLSSSFTVNKTASFVELFLGNNQLTGTIPETLLFNDIGAKRDSIGDSEYENGLFDTDSAGASVARSSSSVAAVSPVGLMATYGFLLRLSNNALTGTVPSNLLATSFDPAGSLGSVVVDFSNNLLEGTFPNDFLAGLPTGITGTLNVALNNNSFTGPVPGFCRPSAGMTIDMSLNNLTGPIPTSWESCMLNQVTLNDNPYLSGSIPTDLFTATGISGFAAKNSSLTGYLPPLGATLSSIDLSYSKFNFCDSYSVASFGSYSASCTLQSSDACNCASEYTQCGSTITCPPPGFLPPYMAPSVPIEPVADPIEPITPNTPVNVPAGGPPPIPFTPSPVTANPPPSNCPPESTRPGPEFTCINGFWTAPAVTNAALVVPAGAGKVIVTGNIDSDEVVLRDLSSSVEVNGCANNLNSINVELTKEDAEQIGSGTTTKTLITTSPSGCNTLNTVNLNTQVSNEGCKKLKTTKQVSPNGSTLNALFSLQTSSCNTWWIILVSVVCGVILLAIILIVILVTCCDCCKKKARPFAGSDGRYSV